MMRELVGLFVLSFLVFYHFKSLQKDELRAYYFTALVVKLIAGICVGLVYTFYYKGGDTWNYFNQAKLMSEAVFSNGIGFFEIFVKSNYSSIINFAYTNQPRAALMTKLVVVINLLTGNNYWITSAYFSFFSFIGVWAFSSWVSKAFKYGKPAALVLFIWPSFVFWSSGILKESVAVGLIFWILSILLQGVTVKDFYKTIKILLSLIFLFMIKYYYAMVLIIVVIIYILSQFFNFDKKNLLIQASLWGGLLIIGFLMGGFFHPNLKWGNIIGVIIENNNAFLAKSDFISTINYLPSKIEWVWLLINIPKALFASLFMPLAIGKNGVLYLVVMIENWVLFLLFIRGTFLIRWEYLKLYSNLLLASVTYTVILAVFLALSTPNLGTLARYKVAFIPILLVWVVLANRLSIIEKCNSKS